MRVLIRFPAIPHAFLDLEKQIEQLRSALVVASSLTASTRLLTDFVFVVPLQARSCLSRRYSRRPRDRRTLLLPQLPMGLVEPRFQADGTIRP